MDKGKSEKIIKEILLPIAGLLFLLVSFISSLHNSKNKQESFQPLTADVYLLDTFCEITVYDIDTASLKDDPKENTKENAAREALDKAIDRLNDYDALLAPDKEGSDIYRINHRNDGGDTVSSLSIDPDTADMLKTGYRFCELTGGLLDPAIMPVTKLWDIKNRKEVPSETEIKKALKLVKTNAWHVDENCFYAEDRDVTINAGSFAKGFIADRIKDILVENNVTSGIINLGGNVLCIGNKPDGSHFKIAYKDAKKALEKAETTTAGMIEITDGSVSTAGVYERYFECDGVIYHHIMDKNTGCPVQNGLLSVTVYGPESVICDAMCTSLFIMGEEKGKAFLENYNRENGTDYKAIFQ